MVRGKVTHHVPHRATTKVVCPRPAPSCAHMPLCECARETIRPAEEMEMQ